MRIDFKVSVDSTVAGSLAALASSLDGDLSAEECNETLAAIEWLMGKFYSDPAIVSEISEQGLASIKKIAKYAQFLAGEMAKRTNGGSNNV